MENSKVYKEQSTRLLNVLSDLNLLQSDFIKVLQCNNISVDAARMSNFVNGNRRITDDVLNALHMFFFINPDYIKGKSDDMYDIPKTILNYAFLFASRISVTENPSRKIKLHQNGPSIGVERYLHITMDEKYYDYLIHLDLLEETAKKGKFDKELVIPYIKELFKNGEHRQKEYVLLPRNTFLNILRTDTKNEVFQELIDSEMYRDYPDCEESFSIE